jgi:hypothetical protein
MLAILDFLKLPEGVRIPYLGGLWYRFISKLEMEYIRKLKLKEYPLNRQQRAERIIVSLTSFPARIHMAHYAIKSLMLQTCKPDQIILWLAEDQFKDILIPPELQELQKSGLDIRFCPDLKSHKKYYYAMKEQKDNLLITYDDDLIYPPNSIERLIKYHSKHKTCIICNRGMEITFDNAGNIKSARNWKVLSSVGAKRPSIKIMPSTGGGCLYPPNVMDDIVFNQEYITKYALSADDIWMKAMSLLKNIKVVKTAKYHRTFSVVDNTQHVQLSFLNDIHGQNDVVVHNLMKLIPSAFENLMRE